MGGLKREVGSTTGLHAFKMWHPLRQTLSADPHTNCIIGTKSHVRPTIGPYLCGHKATEARRKCVRGEHVNDTYNRFKQLHTMTDIATNAAPPLQVMKLVTR